MRFFSSTNAMAIIPVSATAAMEAIRARSAGSPVPGVTVGFVGSVGASVGLVVSSGSVSLVGSVVSLGLVGSVGFGSVASPAR